MKDLAARSIERKLLFQLPFSSGRSGRDRVQRSNVQTVFAEVSAFLWTCMFVEASDSVCALRAVRWSFCTPPPRRFGNEPFRGSRTQTTTAVLSLLVSDSRHDATM